MVIFMTVVARGVSSAVLFMGAFVYGGLVFSIYALSVAHVNDYLAPADVIHATQGLLLVNGIGAVLGPLLVGWMMDMFGPASLLAFFALICVALGGFSVWRMQQRPALPVEQQSEFVVMTRTSAAALEMDPRAELAPELNLSP